MLLRIHSLRDGILPTPDLVTFLHPPNATKAPHDAPPKLQGNKHRNAMRRLVQLGADKATRPTVEMCVTLTAVSAAMVCAGCGDLDILRILRVLRGKLEDVSFGSHMGVSMAIGKVSCKVWVL